MMVKPTPRIIAFLRDIDERERNREVITLPDSVERRTCREQGYIVGRPMKVGFRKKWHLTEKGREALK